MGMLLSLDIKYLQENRELRMRMRMRRRIMLEGRTAINRSDISSGVMSPKRPGPLHQEQIIYYLDTPHVMMVIMIIVRRRLSPDLQSISSGVGGYDGAVPAACR